MRIYSYLFHALLALFLLGVSSVALLSGADLRLGPMLPWSTNVAMWLFIVALIGLTTLLLAVRGTLKVLFFAWSLVVVALLAKGFLLSPLTFASKSTFNQALFLLAGAVLASLGAYFAMKRDTVRR